MTTITSTNAIFTITVLDLFPAPIQLQEFSADNIFGTEPLASAEILMGLDGVLSAGFVHVPVVQNVELQANSPSTDVFDQWWLAQQAAGEVYEANGIIILPALQKKWAMTKGFLSSFPPIPDAAKTLRPRRFGMTWQRVTPSPFG